MVRQSQSSEEQKEEHSSRGNSNCRVPETWVNSGGLKNSKKSAKGEVGGRQLMWSLQVLERSLNCVLIRTGWHWGFLIRDLIFTQWAIGFPVSLSLPPCPTHIFILSWFFFSPLNGHHWLPLPCSGPGHRHIHTEKQTGLRGPCTMFLLSSEIHIFNFTFMHKTLHR